jgi:hypothetical protein
LEEVTLREKSFELIEQSIFQSLQSWSELESKASVSISKLVPMKQKSRLCEIIPLETFQEVFAFVQHVTLSVILARVTA